MFRILCVREKRKRPVALVTAPVCKESINKAYPGFSGHTGFLAGATKTKFVTMFLVSKNLKVALVTRHIPLSRAAASITKDKIIYNRALISALRSIMGKCFIGSKYGVPDDTYYAMEDHLRTIDNAIIERENSLNE